MLQSVSFPVAGTEVLAILHLPAADARGAIALLADRGMQYEHPDLLLTASALADVGIAALRFDWRAPRPTLDDALADVAAALRLLKAHPALPGGIGVAGFGFGGAVAAITAGRDSRVRVAVLAGAPAEIEGKRPIAEVTRTRARVLVIRGAEADDADRYGAVLSQARVTHRIVAPLPRERMARVIADWARESLTAI